MVLHFFYSANKQLQCSDYLRTVLCLYIYLGEAVVAQIMFYVLFIHFLIYFLGEAAVASEFWVMECTIVRSHTMGGRRRSEIEAASR
jgi:hypothetical protein